MVSRSVTLSTPSFSRLIAETSARRHADCYTDTRFYAHTYQQLSQLLDLDSAAFTELVHARARRRFQRGLKRKPLALMKKLRKAKTECEPNEKPAVVKTHLRDMIIVPEMVGSVVGIYNGKVFSASCLLPASPSPLPLARS